MLKGQIITTGSCTGAIKAEINTLIKADFGILGVVELNIYKLTNINTPKSFLQ